MVYTPPKYPGAIPTITDLPNRTDDIDWLLAARYNELKKELRAALIELGTLPKGPDADVTARLLRIQAELDALAAVGPGEGHITILPLSYDSIGQGTWVVGALVPQYLGWQFYNSTHANLDNISWKVYLAAGTYTLLWLVTTWINGAIVDFDVNGTEIASFDIYSAGDVRNVLKKQTGIVIGASGLYTLKLRADGKNPASGDYYCNTSYLALWRTA